jgi:hypothetical protein
MVGRLNGAKNASRFDKSRTARFAGLSIASKKADDAQMEAIQTFSSLIVSILTMIVGYVGRVQRPQQ